VNFNYRIEEEVIFFEGDLNEHVSKGELAKCLDDLGDTPEIIEVKIDMFGLKSGNSMGLRSLYQFLATVEKVIEFRRVPSWLMEQFGMIRSFVDSSWKISSVVLPYYCAELNKDILEIFKVGTDIPILKSYEDYEPEPIHFEGHCYDADYDAESVFFVLTYLEFSS